MVFALVVIWAEPFSYEIPAKSDMSKVQILIPSLDILNFSVTAFQNENFYKYFPEETRCETFLTSQ